MTGFRVFISHTNGPGNMGIVKSLAEAIEAVDIHTYVAENDRQPGTYLADKIKKNILSSDVVMGVWTSDASKSAYVNQELGYAEDKRISFLFLEKGTRPAGFFEGKEYIEFDGANPIEGQAALVEYLKKERKRKSSRQRQMQQTVMIRNQKAKTAKTDDLWKKAAIVGGIAISALAGYALARYLQSKEK